MPTESYIRWMIRRDMTEVVDIENENFEFPWSEEDFIRCLRQRNCIGMVALSPKADKKAEDKVIGFMIYELHKTKLHILNIAISKKCQRQGIGSQLIAKLTSKLSGQRRTRLTLEVRETNLAAQLFFREQGLRAVSTIRNHYEDTSEDAYVMQFRHQPKELQIERSDISTISS